MEKITVGIITYNRPMELKRAILSCTAGGVAFSDIIVWDNCSADQNAVANRAICHKYGVSYYFSEKNRRVAGGRNMIWHLTQDEYIFFLDDDAVVSTENFFSKLCKYMDSNKKVGAASVNIDEPSTGVNHNCKERCSRNGKIITLSYIGGAHILRRSAYPFDDLYPDDLMFGSEELFASLRFWDNGYEVHEIPALMVKHLPEKQIVTYGRNREMQILVNSYIVKRLLYPRYLYPFIKITEIGRVVNNKFDLKEAKKLFYERYKGLQYPQIKNITLLKLMGLFGVRPVI